MALRHRCDEHHHVYQRVPRRLSAGGQGKRDWHHRTVADDTGADWRNVACQDHTGVRAYDRGLVPIAGCWNAGVWTASPRGLVVVWSCRGSGRAGRHWNRRDGSHRFQIAATGTVTDVLRQPPAYLALRSDFTD